MNNNVSIINKFKQALKVLLLLLLMGSSFTYADPGEDENEGGGNNNNAENNAGNNAGNNAPNNEANANTPANQAKKTKLKQKVNSITPAGKAADLKQQMAKAKKSQTGPMSKANLGHVILSLPDSNFMAQDIKWYEGHWQGMDTMELDTELKKKLNYPMGTQGVFVIEVTLNSAKSGILAGDIVTKVGDTKVTELKSFHLATRKIKNKRQAKVKILRKKKTANKKVLMRKHTYMVRGKNSLGFAQMESAPMILPGDIRPHPYRGPCTDCHAVGEGFQLAQDPDLITLPPPVISGSISRSDKPPHEYKGKCPICHQINKTIVPDGNNPGGEVNNIVPAINQILNR